MLQYTYVCELCINKEHILIKLNRNLFAYLNLANYEISEGTKSMKVLFTSVTSLPIETIWKVTK